MFALDSRVFAEEWSDLGTNEFANAQLNNSAPCNVLGLYPSLFFVSSSWQADHIDG